MKISLLSLVIILFLKCNNDNSNNFSLKISSLNKKIKIDDTININIDNKNKTKIDSIQYLLNDIEINSNHTLNNANTGEKDIKAIIYHDSKKTIVNKKITFPYKITRNIVDKLLTRKKDLPTSVQMMYL